MSLLTPSDIRALAARLRIRPTKTLGQNFVHDAGTLRKIVAAAGVEAGDYVLEVGPGLGSLTLALLEAGAYVSAVEIDPTLAAALPDTLREKMPEAAERAALVCRDALAIESVSDLAAPVGLPPQPAPTKLVANLPYNVATPVILTLLARLPQLRDVLVMVQAEVADRLSEPPGSRTYGSPSAKIAWYGQAARAGNVSRNVFWPVPNVDSALVRIRRGQPPATSASREEVFALIDAAFVQRRKTLRAALAGWAGSPQRAEEILRAAGVDPVRRGETLSIDEFCAVASAGAAAEKMTL